jgi:acyl-CoA synthetase (AMP-forming)/AMP-acid ligase II
MGADDVMPDKAAPGASWINAEIRAEFEAAGLWTSETWLQYLVAGTQQDPGALSVVDETGVCTRGEVFAQARRLASYLVDLGVRPGDVITLMLPNWREFVIVHAAVGLAGGVVNPLLPKTDIAEIRHIMETAGTRVVFAAGTGMSPSPVSKAVEAAAELDALLAIVSVRPGPDDMMATLDQVLGEPWERGVVLPGISDATGWDSVTFTSGTESLSKGVVHSHQSTMFGLRAFVRDTIGLGPADRLFMPSPICHASGLQWGLRAAIYTGALLVLQDRWNAATALHLIDEHACTYTLAATPFLLDLVAARRAGEGDGSTLRVAASGGAAIPRHLVVDVREQFGAELVSVFGASETYVTTSTRPGDPDDMLASDGCALPGVQVRIADPATGAELPVGCEGEILTRGPHLYLGYLGPADLTLRSFRGGWHRFGDLGQLDENGMLRVTGRIKDIVIRGGENISVREIEELLAGHPQVGTVAVVGYPDPRLGERCCAVVVPANGAAPTLKSITKFLRERGLAAYKLPERLELVTDMPMTATGKVRKTKIRELLRTTE